MSYKAQILKHLQDGGKTDPIHALNTWGCFSLSQRITELKQAGYPIKSQMKYTPNGKKYAEYWI